MIGAAILKSSGIPIDFKSSEDFIWVPKPIQQVPKPLSEKGSAPSELCLSYNIRQVVNLADVDLVGTFHRVFERNRNLEHTIFIVR